MFDARLRPLIDRSLNPPGRWLMGLGVSANHVTIAGAFFGLLAFIFVAIDLSFFALWLIILNRVADGLDGAVARAAGQTDFGGYLDLVADFVFYSAIPLAFAIADPANAIAACFLCVSFMGTASSFLGFAILAAPHKIDPAIDARQASECLGDVPASPAPEGAWSTMRVGASAASAQGARGSGRAAVAQGSPTFLRISGFSRQDS